MHLEIISNRSNSFAHSRRTLRQYHVEDINTIGVFGDESFSIRFRNSFFSKVQVKLSLDGTDILTGQVANLDPHSKMWVVNAYGTLELSAWPESHQGGAAFVFSTVENSVALHTHGDMFAKGFISCAVFIEGYVPPQRDYGIAMASPDYYAAPRSLSYNSGSGQSIETERYLGPTIGAGSYQEQKINTVAGLREPIFSQLIQVRYLWWDDLVAKLQAQGIQRKSEYPTGFHGSGIDLGDTPRIGETSQTSAVGGYSRFS